MLGGGTSTPGAEWVQATVLRSPQPLGERTCRRMGYSSATNTTAVNLYVNNDATIDSVILMTGDHQNLALGDLFA